MNIFSSWCSGRCAARSRRLVLFAVFGSSVLTLNPALADAPSVAAVAAPEPPTTAVWQPYELHFNYFGMTTYYSCSGLENRLEDLLREMGADKDIRVSVSGCFGPSDTGKMLSASIRVRMPVAASAAQGEAFPVTSKIVTLKSSQPGSMGSGDCELLEDVRRQLLPALKLQWVKDDLRCIPGGVNQAGRSLQVRVLVPAAKP